MSVPFIYEGKRVGECMETESDDPMMGKMVCTFGAHAKNLERFYLKNPQAFYTSAARDTNGKLLYVTLGYMPERVNPK